MEQSELEKKKETLKRLRSLSKPIDLSDLETHKQRYYEHKEKKDKELTEQREKFLMEIENKNKMDQISRSKYNLMNREAALERYHQERAINIEKDKIKEQEKRKMSERVNNYSRYVKEMYFPKVSQAKHDEIEGIISKLKINLSDENISKSTPGDLKKSSSIQKLKDLKNSLMTPGRFGNSKNNSALKTLDKYAVAVKSILEKNEDANGEPYQNHINWKAKVNPMVIDKYVPPQPAEFHDNTVQYLNDLREKRKHNGVNMKNRLIDKVIADPMMKEHERLSVVRHHASVLEKKAKQDELVLMYAGDRGVDREMEVNDMYLDAISAKLKILDKIHTN